MKLRLTTLLIALGGFFMTFQSCEKEGDEGNETKISRHFSSESHNEGQNCMSCHVSGGSGEGWFNVAGTVYDTNKTIINPNSTIKLYTGTGGTGTLKATVEVDARGNFYTTETVSFGDGLYVVVISAAGNQKHMLSKVSSGQCSSCHGVTTDNVWVK
jgi:hypothetical protein